MFHNASIALLTPMHIPNEDLLTSYSHTPEDLEERLRHARESFEQLSSAFDARASKFRISVDRRTCGLNCVDEQRMCYQAFTFVEKRFNDRKAQCQNLLCTNVTEEYFSTPNQQNESTGATLRAIVHGLRSIAPFGQWLEFALALYQRRDGFPYLRQSSSSSREEKESREDIVNLCVELASLTPTKVDCELSKQNLSPEGLTLMRALIFDVRREERKVRTLQEFYTFSVGMNQSGQKFGAMLSCEKGHSMLGWCTTSFEISSSCSIAFADYVICTATYTNNDKQSHRLVSLTYVVEKKKYKKDLCRVVVEQSSFVRISFLCKFDEEMCGMFHIETHHNENLLEDVSFTSPSLENTKRGCVC